MSLKTGTNLILTCSCTLRSIYGLIFESNYQNSSIKESWSLRSTFNPTADLEESSIPIKRVPPLELRKDTTTLRRVNLSW